MKLYAIDASVAARFLLTEELSSNAELVLEEFIVGNTLWKALKQGSINLQEAKEKKSLISWILKLDSLN